MSGRLAGVVLLALTGFFLLAAYFWWTRITSYNRLVRKMLPWRRGKPLKTYPNAEGITQAWGAVLLGLCAVTSLIGGLYTLITGHGGGVTVNVP